MRVLPAIVLTTLLLPAVSSAQAVDLPLPLLYADGPAAPVILSTDMPLSDTWYRPQDATFHWAVPGDITAVAANVATTSGSEPMTPYRPPVSSITISSEEWQEGEQYIVVQFRNLEKWGMYAERRVLIDSTPPESFSIDLVNLGESAVSGTAVAFGTTDSLSGISHYELEVNGQVSRVSPAEAAGGRFVALPAGQAATIRVTAYDLAGNARESEMTVSPVVLAPAAPDTTIAGLISNEPGSILTAIMAALLLIMFGYMVYERQRYAAALRSLREESDDVQTQILKVFNALRMEIYDQVNAIDGKTRLSKKEKEAVVGLTKALEVSEKLLKKEVKDIKKILG